MKSVRTGKLRQLLLRKLDEEAGVSAAKREELKTSDRCSLTPEEGAQATQNMTVHAQLAQVHSGITKGLRDALNRLEAGTYGACTDCGLDIDIPRLEALPFASRCRKCQEEAEGPEYTKTRKLYQRMTLPDSSYAYYKR